MADKKAVDLEYLDEFWEHRVKDMPKYSEYGDEGDNEITLLTEDKTIIGAINELYNMIQSLKG